MEKKLRVWWYPQIGIDTPFYIPVKTPEEAKKIMDLLSAYDCFEFNKNIKEDYCNSGGLEMWNEETQNWDDWYYEDDEFYLDDVDEYCDEKSEQKDELENFAREVLSQVVFN